MIESELLCDGCGKRARWSLGLVDGVEKLVCDTCKRRRVNFENDHGSESVQKQYVRIRNYLTMAQRETIVKDSTLDDIEVATLLGVRTSTAHQYRARAGVLRITPRFRTIPTDEEIQNYLKDKLCDYAGEIDLVKFIRFTRFGRIKIMHMIECRSPKVQRSTLLRQHLLETGIPCGTNEISELGQRFNLGPTTVYKTIREVTNELKQQNGKSQHDDLM